MGSRQYSHHHNHCINQLNLKKKKTGWVLVISLVTMLLEISFGYITNSMALLSDGWHMTSHVIAFGAGWLAYQYVLYQHQKGKNINTSKTLSYIGFINALALAAISVTIFIECIDRIYNPVLIKYNEAIFVAIIGLIVNIVSAKILHHDEEHSDNNIRAAYLHVIADILTSALALIALFTGLYFDLYRADSVVGIIGSLIILNWARRIIVQSWKEISTQSNNNDNEK